MAADEFNEGGGKERRVINFKMIEASLCANQARPKQARRSLHCLEHPTSPAYTPRIRT